MKFREVPLFAVTRLHRFISPGALGHNKFMVRTDPAGDSVGREDISLLGRQAPAHRGGQVVRDDHLDLIHSHHCSKALHRLVEQVVIKLIPAYALKLDSDARHRRIFSADGTAVCARR